MIYLFLYIIGIILIWWTYRVGWLEALKTVGLRPLLAFYFKELKISISSFPIFNKELKKPEDKKMPFFSLVGISNKDNWLCARGRGGGLAIWVKS